LLRELSRATKLYRRQNATQPWFRRGDSHRGIASGGKQRRRRQQLTKVEPLNWGRYEHLKRAVDIASAALLSIALAPLVALVALLVVIDVGPPVVFWQKRPGRSGRPFKLYKFRTMRAEPDRDRRRIADPYRSSGVGRFLRQTRLDELPQLYNIFIGEMSFIGPRPLLPCDQPDDFLSRLNARPGLTGLAQAYGERDMSPNDKNALDIWYIKNASAWLDFKNNDAYRAGAREGRAPRPSYASAGARSNRATHEARRRAGMHVKGGRPRCRDRPL
jgi:lipopolysaccharide/colanic/teichoic acid biosynthesis glycosyltransferase